MISAKTASRNRNLRSPVLPLQKRHKLIDQIALILQMPPDPRSRMHAFVVPTFTIHAVHAEYLQLSCIDLRREHPDHSSIFILKKTPLRAGKNEQRLSGVTKDERFHIALQFVAVVLVMFAIHASEDFTRSGSAMARTSRDS